MRRGKYVIVSPFTATVPCCGFVVTATPVSGEPRTYFDMSIAVGVLSGTCTAAGLDTGTAMPTVIVTVATADVPAGLVTV